MLFKLMLATLGSMVIATSVFANESLAKASNCMACHTVDKKLVGPAYQDVAAKYAKNKDAQKILVEKVRKGGKGVWGEVPMPPNTAVKNADIEKLVAWVLQQKK